MMHRRSFVTSAMLGAAALGGLSAKPKKKTPKNWVWIPTNTKLAADDWKRRFEVMRASGVEAILPEVYAGREAYFASTQLPVKTDWLGMLLPIAQQAGLEVHAWMWCMPCMNPEIMQKHPDWYNVNAKGESAVDKPAYVPYYKFLDPGRPEVREFIQRNVKDLAGIPGLTGVHLDYIRHPDAILPVGLWKNYKIVQDKVYPQYDYGYTEFERAQFQKKYGSDPIKPMDAKLTAKWAQFRWDMVTGLVNRYLVPAAHAGGKKITAAVFPGPSMAKTHVYQDWAKWKLDAFLPMLYHTFYNAGPEWVGEQTREGVAAIKKPLYSGLFIGRMSDAELSQVIGIALKAGASGVSIFSDGAMNEAKWKTLKEATSASPA